MFFQAIYDYSAQDTDEISFSAEEIIEVVKEGEFVVVFTVEREQI